MPLGVNVGYFLELERTFQRKRIVGSAPDEERVAGRRYLASEVADLRFQLERTRHVAWNIGERPHQRHLVVGREHAPIAPSRDSKAGKRRQLAGERLGGSYADFQACERRQYDLARACHCRAWHVDDRKDALPMSFGEFQRAEGVGGLPRLRYK